MKICAIVLNYRKAVKTGTCLESLIGQNIDTALVVDNSADVKSAKELASVLEQLQKEGLDFNVHTITTSENLGFARGVNLALNSRHVEHCDAFLLINNDAVAGSEMVQKLTETLAEVSLSMPIVLDFKGLEQPVFWYQRFLGVMSKTRLPGAFQFPSGCCFLFQKGLLSDGKLFDEDFFMYGEDVLLGWHLSNRAGSKGFKLANDAMVYHTGKSLSKSLNLFYEYHTARAHILLSLKTRRSILEIPLLVVFKTIGITMRATYRTFLYKSPIPLFTFFLGWIRLGIQPDDGKRSN